MGSLLVWATFRERERVGILVWQRGKKSSENGFQMTFSLAGKGLGFKRPLACIPPTLHTDFKFFVISR